MAMLADLFAALHSIIIDPNSNSSVDIQRNEANPEAENPLLLSPVSQIQQMFKVVQELAYGYDVPDVMNFLEKTKKAFLKAKKSATTYCCHYKLITELLK